MKAHERDGYDTERNGHQYLSVMIGRNCCQLKSIPNLIMIEVFVSLNSDAWLKMTGINKVCVCHTNNPVLINSNQSVDYPKNTKTSIPHIKWKIQIENWSDGFFREKYDGITSTRTISIRTVVFIAPHMM